MAEFGIIGGNATVLDWPGNVPDTRGRSNQRRSQPIGDLPSGTISPQTQDIQVFDAAGMDTLYYQARAGLQRLIEAAISQNIDPNGVPDPSNPESFRIKAQITQAKETVSHYGQILSQGKDNQDAVTEAVFQDEGRMSPGFEGGVNSYESISKHFLAGNPMQAINIMNQRMRMPPKTAEEEEMLKKEYDDYVESLELWMNQSGYPAERFDNALPLIMKPQSYNPANDEYRKAQARAANTRAAADYQRAVKGAKGSAYASVYDVPQVTQIANELDSLKSKGVVNKGRRGRAQYAQKELTMQDGSRVVLFGDGSIDYYPKIDYTQAELDRIADEAGDEIAERIAQGKVVEFKDDDMGVFISSLFDNTTLRQLNSTYFPNIKGKDGRINTKTILDAVRSGNQNFQDPQSQTPRQVPSQYQGIGNSILDN